MGHTGFQPKGYEWIVVGGGISGIAIAEILSREGRPTLLIEKSSLLASDVTKIFHEWLHTGTLFTLVPDKLFTLRYLLGAIDDLLDYYQSFPRMNLCGTDSGFLVNGTGWFNNEHVVYKYRIRKINPVWLSVVSRSIAIVEKVKHHDWLRKRAGAGYGERSKTPWYDMLKYIPSQIRSIDDFYSLESPDVTINSRILIADLMENALNNSLSYVLSTEVTSISSSDSGVVVQAGSQKFQSKNVVFCAPEAIQKLFGTKIKIGYAPIAVVDNIPKNLQSFVELDYHIKQCINLIRKPDSRVGQAGGITLDKEGDIKPYLKYIVKEHKKRFPVIDILGHYIGLKKELVYAGQNRNYLYHICHHDKNVWSTMLGKFTLAFSLAPEFYRRVYGVNPQKAFKTVKSLQQLEIISPTAWEEIVALNVRNNYGNDQAARTINPIL